MLCFITLAVLTFLQNPYGVNRLTFEYFESTNDSVALAYFCRDFWPVKLGEHIARVK